VYQRNKELLAKGFVARAEYDASEARYRKAEAALAAYEASIDVAAAALQSARVSLEYTLIRAPFDAVVLTKNADIGDIVTPIGAAAEAKAAVVNIADMTSLQVEVDVSESNLGQVKVGQPCEIQLDAIAESRFNGVVHMVVPTADRTKATVMVKVRFIEKDDRILPEMSTKVAFLSRAVNDEEKTLRTVINPAAIISKGNNKAVFLVKDNMAVEVPLTTGQQFGDMVEVLSGVKAGDRVVLRPLDKIRDGAKIKVAQK
jgi:RND family efflux transporter MFP subunit